MQICRGKFFLKALTSFCIVCGDGVAVGTRGSLGGHTKRRFGTVSLSIPPWMPGQRGGPKEVGIAGPPGSTLS